MIVDKIKPLPSKICDDRLSESASLGPSVARSIRPSVRSPEKNVNEHLPNIDESPQSNDVDSGSCSGLGFCLDVDGLKVKLQASTSRGSKLANEDAFEFGMPDNGRQRMKGVVAILADGVSHSPQPSQASSKCVSEFTKQYFASPASWSTKNAVSTVITEINKQLLLGEQSIQPNTLEEDNLSSTLSNSKVLSEHWLSTVSGMIFKSNTAHVFHVGDSQIIRVRNEKVDRLTKAHNRKLANQSSILTRALGADSHLQVDYQEITIQPNDIFILTTDGVHDYVSERDLVEFYLKSDNNLKWYCESLIEHAIRNGSLDNLTCMAVKIEAVPKPKFEELQVQLLSQKIPPALKEGDFFDSWTVIKVLHASARSHLYLVSEKETDRKFVLKAPSVNFSDDELYIQGFIREAWIGSEVNDSRIMKIFSKKNQNNYLYHICEFVEGQTLRQWMYDHPLPSVDSVRKIIEQIAIALRMLKRLEIVHRDVKPENIMVDSNGQIKLVDFGVASIASLEENIHKVNDTTPVGTLNYLAPETLYDLNTTYQSDLFSLGVIAYEMLAGSFPYPTKTSPSQYPKTFRQWHYRSIRDIRADTPFWLDFAINRAVEPDPLLRYEVYSQFIRDITKPNLQELEAYKVRPIIERNPIKFWKVTSGILMFIVVFLFYILVTQ